MANLTASWLAARDGNEWRYPRWQFDGDGRVRPAVQRLLEIAKQDGIPHDRLEELLERKIGLVGGKSLRELLLNGGADQALAEVRGAA